MSLSTALAKTNPAYAGTRRDWEVLLQSNPGKAASIAHNNSSRLANALTAAENATVMALELLFVGGTNVVLSLWDGSNDYKRNVMIDEWRNPQNYDPAKEGSVARKASEYLAQQNLGPVVVKGTALTQAQKDKLAGTSPFKEGGFKDPTVFLGLPILMWTTGVTGLVAFLTRKSKFAYVSLASAVGSFTAWTSSLGHELGMRMAAKRAVAAANKANGQGG